MTIHDILRAKLLYFQILAFPSFLCCGKLLIVLFFFFDVKLEILEFFTFIIKKTLYWLHKIFFFLFKQRGIYIYIYVLTLCISVTIIG